MYEKRSILIIILMCVNIFAQDIIEKPSKGLKCAGVGLTLSGISLACLGTGMLFLSNYYHSKIPQFVINANDENVSAQDQNSRKEFWTGILGGFCVLAAPPIEIAGIYIWKGYNNGMREYKHSRLVLYLSPSSLKIVGLF